MVDKNEQYAVFEEGGVKKIERVVTPLSDQGGITFNQNIDPLTMALLAPFYVIGAVLALPAYIAMALIQNMQSGGVFTPRQPKMLVTEIVRDENGRIVEVVERIV